MSLKGQITEDMKSAMKAGEKDRLKVVRLILAGIKQIEVDTRAELDDAAVLGVEEGMVAEGGEIEVSVQRAVDVREQVEVEGRSDAAGVVVSGLQHALRLGQVDADQQPPTRTQQIADPAQEALGLQGLEVADGRAGEEGRTRMVVVVQRQYVVFLRFENKAACHVIERFRQH